MTEGSITGFNQPLMQTLVGVFLFFCHRPDYERQAILHVAGMTAVRLFEDYHAAAPTWLGCGADYFKNGSGACRLVQRADVFCSLHGGQTLLQILKKEKKYLGCRLNRTLQTLNLPRDLFDNLVRLVLGYITVSFVYVIVFILLFCGFPLVKFPFQPHRGVQVF